MIDDGHDLPILRQAQLLELSRSVVYYRAQPTSAADLALMRRIDELHLEYPFAGARMLRDLNSVLDYFAQLNELDTSSVPPMAQVADQVTEGRALETVTLHLRPDEIAPSLNREQVMACAPDTDGVFFRVPKVIER